MARIATDWRRAGLDPLDEALCAYAEKVSRAPETLGAADLDALRAQGLDDRGIHDAVQVIAYFNYINRVADALGVENEDFIRAWERGEDCL